MGLLTGCADSAARSDPQRTAASDGPSAVSSTAPGVDGEADSDRVFTEAELKAALLPAGAFGGRAEVAEVHLGGFGRFGGGDWGQCEAADELREKLAEFQGASAQQVVHLGPEAEPGGIVTVQLVSMPAARAERYLEIRHRLNESCPEVTVDTEAAPAQEHHEAHEVPALGDETLLEISRLTGGDEYDGSPTYTVDVRVGGVLAIVVADDDRDAAVSLAARAAQWVRSDLYRADS